MSDPSKSPESSFEQAKALFLSGLGSYQSGDYEQAERDYAASLALVPARISTLVNLAAAQMKRGRYAEALATADRILEIEPDNCDALFHRANALVTLSRPTHALQTFERLLALDPNLAPAWSGYGDLLRGLGRIEAAADAYRQAIAHDGDPELNGYYLASLDPKSKPATAPRAYVEGLFDGYAHEFEHHVVKVLRYRAHEVLTQPLAQMHPARFRCALDLGCGTGLCGPLVRPLAERLIGVDLSGGMLARANALGVYDQLLHSDIGEFLAGNTERFDLVIAADVFIYVGALEAVFERVSAAMDPGGVFCFSAEVSARAEGYELLPSLRYAHSQHYLRDLARRCGFDVKDISRQPIREDQKQRVDGLFVFLVKR